MIHCERCIKRGVETDASRVLLIQDVVDEDPEGGPIISNHDAFSMGLCLSCASDLQQQLMRLLE